MDLCFTAIEFLGVCSMKRQPPKPGQIWKYPTGHSLWPDWAMLLLWTVDDSGELWRVMNLGYLIEPPPCFEPPPQARFDRERIKHMEFVQ
jgi:hypothetical protein